MERTNLNIIMYHYVRDLSHSRYPKIKGLDTELFKEQITYLKKNFTIVKMEDIIDKANGGGVSSRQLGSSDL